VIDFGQDSGIGRDEAGLWAGFVAGTYFFGQFLSSFVWGVLSDRYGRKKLLIAGSCGTLVSIICFGFSQSLAWAIASRTLAGILNGNLGIAKSLLGEVSTSKTQAQTFGMLAVFWACGSICGSIVGGILARPAAKYAIFAGTIFEEFPYLLISMATALMFVIAIVLNVIFLKEPERKQAERPKASTVLKNLIKKENRQSLLAVGMYAMLGCVTTFNKETFPLFYVSSPSAGGLNFGTNSTGYLIGSYGLSTIIFQLFIYKRITDRLGMVWTHRLGILGSGTCILLVPLAGEFYNPDSMVGVWIYLILLFSFWTCVVQMCFSSVFVLISNSCHKPEMGTVNGLAQSLVAILRCVAPPIAGRLFAWSISGHHPFPLNQYFNFILQFLIFTGFFGLSFLYDPALNAPRDEKSMETEEIEMLEKAKE
jgi:MFS family permease